MTMPEVHFLEIRAPVAASRSYLSESLASWVPMLEDAFAPLCLVLELASTLVKCFLRPAREVGEVRTQLSAIK
jgi:hypothetical protein